MILPALLLSVIVGVIAVPAIQRLFDLKKVPLLSVLVVLSAMACPAYVASTVLAPGEPLQSVTVAAQKDAVELTLPAGHSLMVTANLSEDEDLGKTSYALQVKGDKWAENLTGTIKRSGSGGGPDVDIVDGEGISNGGRRSGAVGEDLQERYDIKGTGDIVVTVTNYVGGAATSLVIDVIKGPPPVPVLWGFAALIAILGLYLELKKGCERFSGDMATLACYGALLPQSGITPLDNVRGIAFAGLGAILLGQGAVQAVAWVGNKYLSSLERAAEPPPEPEEPRRKKRRRS
ncbi:MAG: hypothetical protein ACI8RZ_005824 [Myxococcota bacterium]|jgi:hypothetical protein